MLLVGYNDNFRVDNGKFGDLKERTLGGFIIKNSWGPQMGHSIKYWTQEISTLEESFLCPDIRAANKWLPVDSDCMLNGGTPQSCSEGLYKRVRDQWVTGATELKCAASSETSKERAAFYGFADCNPDKRYLIAKAPSLAKQDILGSVTSGPWIRTYENDFFDIYMVEYTANEDGTVSDVKRITIKQTTWIGLSHIFTPVMTGTEYDNDPDVCGYFFLPYQYFQEGNVRAPVEGHDTSSCSAFKVEWDDSSYLANKDKYPQYDYTFLEQSQKTMGMYHFKGADDYDYKK